MFSKFQDYLRLDAHEAVSSQVFWYCILLIFLLAFFWWIISKARVRLVSVFSDDEGAVQITPQALRELVRRSCETIPGVHSPNTTIFIKNKKTRLLVKLQVEPNCRVKEIRSVLKEKLETVMVNNLNFSNFSGMDIIIKGFQDSTE